MRKCFNLLLSILLIGFSLTVHSQAAGQDGSSVDDVLRLKPEEEWGQIDACNPGYVRGGLMNQADVLAGGLKKANWLASRKGRNGAER
ncbi:MAG: hypothetical protein HN919_13185 [Verrucomicrobia bacterium]|jgi:hypothetical protein|nr:hypothetical protein [Verrucomicrobiota bacterium]MBT7067255.1 hypothetical protein [Verrucomicrobiota bacterium]MBT7701609.1 hypothetical protein [Verrucomicrobiota bacterium]